MTENGPNRRELRNNLLWRYQESEEIWTPFNLVSGGRRLLPLLG